MKWKRRDYNRQWRNTKDYKRILWTAICQQIGQPIRNGQILRIVQPSKTESRRNGKSEQSDSKYRGWNNNQKALKTQNS